MSKLSQFFKHWYIRFFSWLIAPEHRGHPVMEFKVHMLLFVVFITGILMWAYAFLAFEYINHSSIKYTGFLYALTHLLAPFVYRQTKSITAATYTMLIPGGAFQTHFSLLTGGFYTTTIVWVGILPLIAGILTDRFHTFIWGLCSTLAIICTFILTIYGFTGDYYIQSGKMIAQFQVTFGMIILNSIFTIFLLLLASKYEEIQKRRKIAFQNLLRIMVHDIANPLTVIMSIGRSLGGSKNNPSQENYFHQQIISQTTKVASIIESVRWMEGLESGKKTPQTQIVNLCLATNAAVNNITDMAKAKNIQISVDMPETLTGLGHPTVIENQILTNILSNCIKFSPSGSYLKIIGSDINPENSEIMVIDQGIGIPDYILENIFDPFYPTSRKGTQGEDGTGFGMPIALKCMEFFKGTIHISTKEIESYPLDHGTIFTLQFKK